MSCLLACAEILLLAFHPDCAVARRLSSGTVTLRPRLPLTPLGKIRSTPPPPIASRDIPTATVAPPARSTRSYAPAAHRSNAPSASLRSVSRLPRLSKRQAMRAIITAAQSAVSAAWPRFGPNSIYRTLCAHVRETNLSMELNWADSDRMRCFLRHDCAAFVLLISDHPFPLEQAGTVLGSPLRLAKSIQSLYVTSFRHSCSGPDGSHRDDDWYCAASVAYPGSAFFAGLPVHHSVSILGIVSALMGLLTPLFRTLSRPPAAVPTDASYPCSLAAADTIHRCAIRRAANECATASHDS